jgi:hypothetical protein
MLIIGIGCAIFTAACSLIAYHWGLMERSMHLAAIALMMVFMTLWGPRWRR